MKIKKNKKANVIFKREVWAQKVKRQTPGIAKLPL